MNVTDVVLVLDAQDRYLWVSPSVREVLGWCVDDVLGRSSRDFVSTADQRRLEVARQGARGGVAHLDEMQVRCKNGDVRWVSNRSTAITLPDGSAGRVVVVRDMHEAVLARQALAESDARFRLLAEHAGDIVCLEGRNRELIWISPNVERTLGWRVDELLGTTIRELAHPDEIPVNDPRMALVHDGVVHDVEVFGRLRTKDGGWRWMSGRATPSIDADGEVEHVVLGLRVVDDLVAARQEAERIAEQLRTIMDSTRDGILRFGRDRCVEYVNPEVVRVSGWPESDWVGRRVADMGYTGEAAALYEANLLQVFADGEPRRFEFSIEHDGGTRHQWFEANMAPVFGEGGVVLHVMSTNRDITDRRSAEQELTFRATRDQLTGLANRTSLIDELARAVASARRTGRYAAALMIDLDHFKAVNDSLGHAVGDQLLVAAARRLERVVRSADLAGRLGGDEFVVVMRDLDDIDDARQLGQRIVESFRQPLLTEGHDLGATTSIGIACSSMHTDATDLLREADTALYAAKQLGRDRLAMFTDTLRDAVTNRLELSGQLRPAFERCEFEVWYQPEVDLSTGEVIALEALVRWNHQSGEVYAADRFIDIADETGVLADIGDWVLFQACRHSAEWQKESGRARALRVNLSTSQLADSHLLTTLDEALELSGLDPMLLCLEVTESSLLRDNPTARENLAAVRARGIRISLDDFGTGFASLSSLRDMPIDLIKIDRSFIAGIDTDERDHRIVAGIVALAQRLGIAVTAEGVETEHQAYMLRAMHCAGAQGYLFARPLPAAQVAAHLQRHDRLTP